MKIACGKVYVAGFEKALLILSICFSLCLMVNFSCYAGNIQHQIIQEINLVMPSMIKNNDATGAAIAIVNNKRVIWSKGYGYLSKNRKTKVNTHTLFSMESDSKMFTATAVLLAAQNGMLRLDVPIAQYLPNFHINSRFSKNPLKRITLLNLLSHTAGFPSEAAVGNNYDPTSPSFEVHINSIQKSWLRYPVEQRFAYSNLGIDLAGYILQKRSGTPFYKYMQNNVLKPLNMRSSTFNFQRIRNSKNRAIGNVLRIKHVPLKDFGPPSGGLYSNVIDISKFIQFQLNNGKVRNKQMLTESYLTLMHTVPNKMIGQKSGYALGVTKVEANGMTFYCHSGGALGFNSLIFWVPEYNFGGVIVTNGYVGNAQWVLAIKMLALLSGNKHLKLSDFKYCPAGKKAVSSIKKITQRQLRRWIGNYVDIWSNIIKITVYKNQLEMNRADKHYLLQYIGNNKFYDPIQKQLFKFIPASAKLPKYIVDIGTGDTWDYNDGPNDKPGPNIKEWRNLTGSYHVRFYQDPKYTMKLHVKNGYLYLDGYRLKEFANKLFVSADGQILDLTGAHPVWNNAGVLKNKND